MDATRELFHKHLEATNAQAGAQIPTFFQPPPAPEQPGPASYVSAPVSRGAVGGYREPSPSQVKLSPDELQIAAASGISATEYAKNKLRLAREKASGERQ